MTPLSDDELVTAVLDGEATAADAAKVAADPVLAARLEELRAVRHAVGAPVEPAAPGARDRAIAAALAAAAQGDAMRSRDEPALAPPPPVTRQRRRWLVPAVAAAAVAAIVGIALVASGSDSGSGTSTAAGGAVTTAADSAGAGADAAPTSIASAADAGKATAPTATAAAEPSRGGATTTAGGAVAPTPEAGPPAALGALDTPDDVRAKVAQVRNSVRVSPPAAVVTPCAAPATGALLVGVATWQGTPAYVFAVEEPPARALLLATLDCHLLAEVPLT